VDLLTPITGSHHSINDAIDTQKEAHTMDSPLLAPDDDTGTPLLSLGPMIEEEESRLSLLMRRPSEAPLDEILEPPPQERVALSLVTIIAGSLTLLQCGLVWGSFLSNSWTETHLHTFVNWLERYVTHTDTIVQTLDLGSVVSILRASHEYTLLALVTVTAVVIPCLGIIANPVAIAKQFTTFREPIWVDLIWRFSFFIIWMFVFFDLSTSFIKLEWTDTLIEVYSCVNSGMFTYLLGMTAAVLVVVSLSYDGQYQKEEITRRLFQPRTPAAAGFRHPWPSQESDANAPVDSPVFSQGRHGKMHSCFVQQLGLAAAVLLIPSFSLPLLRVSYTGLAAEFMPETRQELFLVKLPWLLWHHHAQYSNKSMLIICGTILILQACVIPLLALACGLRRRGRYRTWLCSLYPMMNGLTLAITSILFAPALDSISKLLLDSSILCKKFDNTVGEPCLVMSGMILPGAWCFLAHSILLDTFVALTLWSSR
jgi:hypothetical protein